MKIRSAEYVTAAENGEDSTSVATAASATQAEAFKIAASYQRELYRTQDSRLSSIDGSAGMIVAVAIAVVTFTGGLIRDTQVSVTGVIATSAMGLLVTVLALYARMERPRWVSNTKMARDMQSMGDAANDAVGILYARIEGGELVDPGEASRLEYDAWHKLSDSITARRKVKSTWYFFSVFALLIEVMLSVFLAVTAT